MWNKYVKIYSKLVNYLLFDLNKNNCLFYFQVQPSVVLGSVPLVPAKGAYKELKLTDAITMLVPHPPLFPLSRLHIPVFVDRQKAKLLTAIVVR